MNEPTYKLSGVVKARASGYEDFEGPLDLILLLLSKNRIEIRDIKIALILDQYLEWLERMQTMDLEIASEFVAMASHLVYLKTKSLVSYDEELESEMELLIRSLEERQSRENYQKIKGVLPQLAALGESGRDFCVKAPEPLPPGEGYGFVHEKDELYRALCSVFDREERKLPPPRSAFRGIVGREPYPVSKKSLEIIERLLAFGTARFKALFSGSRSRSELVATFIAVLELCRAGRLRISGAGGDCTLSCQEIGGEGSENGAS